MSGRAGRRGLDDTGVVIIACSDDVPEVRFLVQLNENIRIFIRRLAIYIINNDTGQSDKTRVTI